MITFRTPEHDASQERVARVLEQAWGARLQPAGGNARVNYYATRSDDPLAWLKIKCRQVSSGEFARTYLGLYKYEALMSRHRQTGLPSLFVVGFNDGIRWIDVRDVDASAVEMAGRQPRLGATHDYELMVQVPVFADMHPIAVPKGWSL